MPETSIVIINWKGRDDTYKCINSVCKSDYKNFEIILIDNDSGDGSVEFFRKKFPQKLFSNLRIIANPCNAGLAEGFNIGIRNSKGDFVFLLTNDTILEKLCLGELVKTIKSNLHTAIVSPKIKNLKAYGRKETSGAILNILFQVVDIPKKVSETSMANGTAMLLRKSSFQENPFIPEYFGNCEDVFISILAQIKGYKIAVNPKAGLIHTGSVSVSKVPDLMSFHMDKNFILNFFILYQVSTILRLLPVFIILQFLTMLNALFTGKFMHKAKSCFWIIKNLPLIPKYRKRIKSQRTISDSRLISSVLSSNLPVSGIMVGILNPLMRFYLIIFGFKTRY